MLDLHLVRAGDARADPAAEHHPSDVSIEGEAGLLRADDASELTNHGVHVGQLTIVFGRSLYHGRDSQAFLEPGQEGHSCIHWDVLSLVLQANHGSVRTNKLKRVTNVLAAPS